MTAFWRKVLVEEERTALVNNIVGHLYMAQPFLQERAIENFSKVDPEYGRRIREGLNRKVSS